MSAVAPCDKCAQSNELHVYGAINDCVDIWSLNCGAHTTVRTCNDCQRLCRSTFSKCWQCQNTDICEDCITTLRYEEYEELCTACYEAHNKNEEKRERVFQEEFRKREAEHKRNCLEKH
jgi:hypothetical protein